MNRIVFGQLAAGLLYLFMNTCQYCRFAFTNEYIENIICLRKISSFPLAFPPFDELSRNCAVLADFSCVCYAPRFFHQLPLPLDKFFLIEDIVDIDDYGVVQLDLFENAFN